MSHLVYRGINLEVVKTIAFEERPVYSDDGTDYMFTHYRIEVQALYNPACTAYGVDEGGNPVERKTERDDDGNVEELGALPHETDLNIRQHLLEPRGELRYGFSGLKPTILSPPLDSQNRGGGDAFNGPRPLYARVHRMGGERSWIVHFGIETWLNSCPDTIHSYILSNRWSQAHQVDDQHRTTRLTQGVATFRLDLEPNVDTADGPRFVADAFRASVLPTIPAGFKREAIRVAVNPTGNTLNYVVADVEQFHSLGDTMAAGSYGVVDFASKFTVANYTPDKDGAAAPSTIRAIDVRVKGNKSSIRRNLLKWALMLASSKLEMTGAPFAAPPPTLRRVLVSEALEDRLIDLHIEVMAPPAPVGPKPLGLLSIGATFGLSNESVFVGDGKNPQPPYSHGTRGTYRGYLVAQKVRAACEIPIRLESTGAADAIQSADYDPTQASDETTATLPAPNNFGPAAGGGGVVGAQGIVAGGFYSPVVDVVLFDGIPSQANLVSSTSHTDYAIDFVVRTDRHTMQVPRCAPTPVSNGDGPPPRVPSSIIVLAQPTSKLFIEFSAERIGAPPILPAPNVSDANFVLLHDEVMPHPVTPMPDGQTLVYRVTGRYEYAARLPIFTGLDALPFPVLPWTSVRFGDEAASVLPAANFQHGVIDPPTYRSTI